MHYLLPIFKWFGASSIGLTINDSRSHLRRRNTNQTRVEQARRCRVTCPVVQCRTRRARNRLPIAVRFGATRKYGNMGE